MIVLRDVQLRRGTKVLLERANVTLHPGEKVGLVGANGIGKSSLMALLLGQLHEDRGECVFPTDWRIAQVAQHMPESESSATDFVLEGDSRLQEARAELQVAQASGDGMALAHAHTHLEDAGVHDAPSRAQTLLLGLGFGPHELDRPVNSFSGGWRMRLQLARALMCPADLLLLDEPTNHLDIDAKNWLLNYMRNYKGALLVISHDLELLDEAITRVLHLDRPDEDDIGAVFEYRGTYSQYKKSRAEDEARAEKKAMMQAKEVARLQEVVDKFGAKATKASMAHSIEKRIARIEAEGTSVRKKDRQLTVKFPDPPQSGVTVLTTKGLSKGYGGPPVFEDVSFDLGRGDRFLVLGLNGAGKTSLLRILAGATEANIGTFEWGYQVSVGYFAQEHDTIDPKQSLLWHMRRELPSGSPLTETQLRALLGMFGLQGDKVFQDSGSLSGGEKTKLALAMLMVGRNNVLLLDEPTNNLDPHSREAVATALESWKGTIIMVSHDEEFVQRLEPTKVILMPDGQVDYFSQEWLELVSLA